MARAVYARPDVALLDDTFSALDATTASAVFDSLFLSSGPGIQGVLRNSATVLVTHAIHFLPRVDRILVLEKGYPKFCGTWCELQEAQGNVIESIQSSEHGNVDQLAGGMGQKTHLDGLTDEDGIIMTKEVREHGVASFWVWVTWFKNAGGWGFFLLQFLFLILDRGIYVMSDW